jgi:hypothetical protein
MRSMTASRKRVAPAGANVVALTEIITHFHGLIFLTITLRSPCGQIPGFAPANSIHFKLAYTFAA